jgi:hypothetical protein
MEGMMDNWLLMVGLIVAGGLVGCWLANRSARLRG